MAGNNTKVKKRADEHAHDQNDANAVARFGARPSDQYQREVP